MVYSFEMLYPSWIFADKVLIVGFEILHTVTASSCFLERIRELNRYFEYFSLNLFSSSRRQSEFSDFVMQIINTVIYYSYSIYGKNSG